MSVFELLRFLVYNITTKGKYNGEESKVYYNEDAPVSHSQFNIIWKQNKVIIPAVVLQVIENN